MIPRLAALSIAEISVRTCSGLGVCTERTVFCIVRRPVRTLRLRSDRFTVWRARLAADFVFAIVIKSYGPARSRVNCDCQPLKLFKPAFTEPARKRRIGPGAETLQSFVQFELRFLPLSSKRSTLPHLFDRERSVGSGSGNCLVLRFCTRGYEGINGLRSRRLCDFR